MTSNDARSRRARLLGTAAPTLLLALAVTPTGVLAQQAPEQAQTATKTPEQQAQDTKALREAQGPAGAPGATSQAPGMAATEASSQEIVVTGSRIATSGLTSMTPVAQLGALDIKLSGASTVENVLNTIPQVVPSESGFTNNNSSGTATINLRGLGTQRNLVLVNGRRFIFFDARQVTDLNTIPTALIKRVELITGGSSAVYGSDAISGVVNFILRNNLNGAEATAQYDITGVGDAAKFNADLVIGHNFLGGRGNITAFFNYFKRDPALADARKESQCFLGDLIVNTVPALVCGGSSGIPNGRIAGLPLGAALAARPAVQQALANLGLSGIGGLGFKFDASGRNVSPFVSPDDQYNFNPLNYLQLPQIRKMGGVNAKLEISPAFEPYLETIYVKNTVNTKRAPTPVGGSVEVQTNSPFLTPALQQLFMALDATEPSLATRNNGYTSVAIGRRVNEVGTRDVSFNRDAYRYVVGVRGSLGDVSPSFLTNLKYDAYYSYARTDNKIHSTGNISDARFRQGVTTAFDARGNLVCRDPSNGCVPINIFGANISPAAAQFITIVQDSSEQAKMQVATGAVTGELFKLPAGPIGFAAGLEYRKVYALFIPPQGGVGDVGVPSGGGYNVKEAFGEIRIPVFSMLELTGAFRYSDYSLRNIRGVWTYGAGATFRPFEWLMLRGQYQRAVRAPSVSELYAARSTTSDAATDPCALASAATNSTIRGLCLAGGVPAALVGSAALQPNFQITGIVGGNPDLKEEKTDTYTVGAVVRPSFIPRLNLTIDYYKITVNDAIARLGGSINGALNICYNVVQDINSSYCQAVQRGPTGVIESPGGVSVLNANIGTLKTDGIDVGLGYTAPLGIMFGETSRLSISSAVSWLNHFERTPVALLPQVVQRCGGAFGLTCGEPLPTWKATTRVTLDIGETSISARWRWIGSVTDDQVTSGQRAASTLAVPVIPATNYFDLSANWNLKHYSFFIGVLNIFNRMQTLIGSSQEQLNTYPSTYDPLGRRFYAGATVKF